MKLIDDYREFTRDGGVSKKISTIFLNPCFHSVCLYRLSHVFYKIHLSIFGKIIWYINRLLYHVDIDYRADLAGGLVLVHGLGTVIGKNVISKGKLMLYQNVTLGGGNGKEPRLDSDGKYRGMPLFEDDVIVYTGAIVVGGIIVSKGARIKAGRIVTEDVIIDH